MVKYCLGFLFNTTRNKVVLIEKKHPKWQAGFLNGVGGKVEGGESSYEAMIREFSEETGTISHEWVKFCSLGNTSDHGNTEFAAQPWSMDCFYGTGSFSGLTTTTDEDIYTINIKDLEMVKTLPNVKWLVPMALSMKHDRCSVFNIRETY